MNRRKPNINIEEVMYQKTHSKDGITQIVDTDKEYKMYHLTIEKNYYGSERYDLIENIIEDLKELERALEKELERSEER